MTRVATTTEPAYLTLDGLAAYANVSVRTVRKWITLSPDEALPVYRLASGLLRVGKLDFEAWQQEREDLAARVAQGLERMRHIQFSGRHVRMLRGPVVYVWMRADRALYVGRSSNGLARCFAPRHVARKILDTDSLKVYPLRSETRAASLEADLIHYLQPEHNVQGKALGRRRDHGTCSSEPTP